MILDKKPKHVSFFIKRKPTPYPIRNTKRVSNKKKSKKLVLAFIANQKTNIRDKIINTILSSTGVYQVKGIKLSMAILLALA
jgi:hypothetical protein